MVTLLIGRRARGLKWKVVARLKGARLSAQKARLVADQVRGRAVEEALELLTYSPKKGRSNHQEIIEFCDCKCRTQ